MDHYSADERHTRRSARNQSSFEIGDDANALQVAAELMSRALVGEGTLETAVDNARAVRQTLALRRLARREMCKMDDVGGTRPLPRRVRASLRLLSQIQRLRDPGDVPLIADAVVQLSSYGIAIRNADVNWRKWQLYREQYLFLPSRPDPRLNLGLWLHPRVHQLYEDLLLLVEQCCRVTESLAVWRWSGPQDLWFRLPRADTDDATWYSDLQGHWRQQVWAPAAAEQLSLLDDLAIDLLKAWRLWHVAQRSNALAAPDLDSDVTNDSLEITEEISGALDNLRYRIPPIPRVSKPAKLFSSFSVRDLQDATRRVSGICAALRTIALLERHPTTEPQVGEQVSRVTAPTKTVGRSAPRMTKDEANIRARELLQSDKTFARRTAEEWARAIGCSTGLVCKLPVWKAVKERLGKRRNRGTPKVVQYDEKLTPVLRKHRESDVPPTSMTQPTLQDVIREQQADFEPSPLDDSYSAAPRSRKGL